MSSIDPFVGFTVACRYSGHLWQIADLADTTYGSERIKLVPAKLSPSVAKRLTAGMHKAVFVPPGKLWEGYGLWKGPRGKDVCNG